PRRGATRPRERSRHLSRSRLYLPGGILPRRRHRHLLGKRRRLRRRAEAADPGETRMIAPPSTHTNPYVGPREFRAGEKLYGRDREMRRLVDLLIARRLVLLHSPSGAGKTSLIQAAVVPELDKQGFMVLGPIRVTGADPKLIQLAGADANRYVLCALQCLEADVPPDRQLPPETLVRLDLPTYLAQRVNPDANGHLEVLVFDQFEELLAAAATDGVAIRDFIAQVSTALASSSRWALISMRED